MSTLKYHNRHISMTTTQRKVISFIIALAVTMILFNVLQV